MASVLTPNADGLVVKYPDYYKDPFNKAVQLRGMNTMGMNKQLVVDIDFTQIADGTTSFTTDITLDGTRDGFNDGDVRLPAYSSIRNVVLLTTTAATGGTSFTVGTYRKAGTTISATGLVTATEGVIANINTIGKRTYGAGAYVSTAVGTASIGSKDAYIGVTATGVYTAGVVRMIVEYVDPIADAFANI